MESQETKIMAAIGYILFFVPLLAAKDSSFARYHANQGLVLLLTSFAVNIVLGLIPFIGWVLMFPVSVVILIFVVIGILNAVNGRTKPLPVIGGITIIK
ncbi:Uncharacterized membrane protein [Paenibacillus sp. UNCCL117]|uniref:DUF4870 domain-containing protein n=1 Tax=unclassified Paenibacillus TaxID=185978 RepID=UPI0008838FD1|nr:MULTISPECIES: hypothetical protein [unclassified Paenibacillus]SDE29481.1 Uncharacterized membrane protein [Paenibacillus sp. cl123]SFW63264.1 Uncharacterized membrane protein [Paenibacillus sp. UNCCL117]